jgi:thiol-disulfide isomerase/thioredoxin
VFAVNYPRKNVPTFKKEYSLQLVDYSGHSVQLSEFKNTVLIAYAWASWCPYCGAELEHLADLKQHYGDGVRVIGINRGESLAMARDFTSRLAHTEGVTFLLDPSDSFFKQIGGYAMPETVFVRPNGEILFHQRGPMQYVDVEAKLKEILDAR